MLAVQLHKNKKKLRTYAHARILTLTLTHARGSTERADDDDDDGFGWRGLSRHVIKTACVQQYNNVQTSVQHGGDQIAIR